MDAWVRLPAVSSRPAGGYYMEHGTARPDALVSASSPKAARVEMHSMSMVNGVMRMRAETRFPVTAKGTLSFAPGGNHLMLFGLAPDVKPGQTIPITLGFESGAKATVQARTMAAAAPAPEKAHQH
jgi:copper(I)-binding protein